LRVVAWREVGGEVRQPRWWVIESLDEVGRADRHSMRGAIPASLAPSGAGQPGDRAAIDAGGVGVRWPAGTRAGAAPARGLAQHAGFAAARALGFLRLPQGP